MKQIEPEKAYKFYDDTADQNVIGYAWSPDGLGLYWYDTREELIADHPQGDVVIIHSAHASNYCRSDGTVVP